MGPQLLIPEALEYMKRDIGIVVHMVEWLVDFHVYLIIPLTPVA